MDPKLQEPTFETTLTDVTSIRGRYGSQDDQDWPKHKLIFVNAVKSGQRLEQRMVNAEAQIEHYLVRKTEFEKVEQDVRTLKVTAKERKSFRARWGGRLWQIVQVVIAVLVTHWLDK